MTKEQLISMAKRINQQIVQHEKTFGADSPAYKQLVSEVQIRFNGHTHVTKSGKIAINTGAYLSNYEHQLNILDRSEHKVKGIQEQAREIIKQEMRERGYTPEQIKTTKISQKQIKNIVNKVADISDFFNNKLGDYYALREVVPEIGELLAQLETDGKKSYSELERIKNELIRLKSEYDTKTLTDTEVEQQRNVGKPITSEGL